MSFWNKQPDFVDKKLNPLIKHLGHKDTAKCEQAKREIIAAIAEEPQRLSTLLFWVERELRGIRSLLRWVKFTAGLFILFEIWDLVHHRWFKAFELLMKSFMLFLTLAIPLTNQPRLKLLLNIVSELQDKRFIGHLVESYRYQEVRSFIVKTLLVLLPQLQHSDARLLNEQQRTILYQSLNDKNTDWIRTVLKALEQIGDSKAVPYVEKLATASNTEPEIREAAQECLVYLKQRLEQQQISQTLLRASDAVAAGPDMLLRASMTADTTEPNQLLRAGSSNVSSDR